MKHLKHLSLIAAILTVVMTPWAESRAQTATKPAAVITLSSVDELVGDAKHVIEAIGLPGIDDQLNAMLEPFTAGIDRSKAIGAVVSLEGELGFTLKAFVPVKNFSQMMQLVQAQLGPAQDAVRPVQREPLH